MLIHPVLFIAGTLGIFAALYGNLISSEGTRVVGEGEIMFALASTQINK